MADFYPKSDGDKITFLNNLQTGLTAEGTNLGLAADELAGLATAIAAYQAAVIDKTTKRAAAQSATANCHEVAASTEDTVRSLVRRVKAAPAYTVATGRLLGIEVGGDATAQSTVGGGPRPDLEATSVVHGEVVLTFIKNGFSGVEIESQRGTEPAFTFLARDTQAPYIDTRPSLAEAPETRRYRARYLHNDTVTADYSDVLVVTVPGAN